MENPFEVIMKKLNQIENLIKSQGNTTLNSVMSVEQLANLIDLSKSHIYKKTSAREIPHYKRGKKLYFSKQEIDKWILKNRIETTDEIDQLATDYRMKNQLKFP